MAFDLQGCHVFIYIYIFNIYIYIPFPISIRLLPIMMAPYLPEKVDPVTMSQEGSQVPFHFAVTDLEPEKSYVGGRLSSGGKRRERDPLGSMGMGIFLGGIIHIYLYICTLIP